MLLSWMSSALRTPWGIDDKSSPQEQPGILNVSSKIAAKPRCRIGNHGISDLRVGRGIVVPGLVNEDGVRAEAQDFGAILFELVVALSSLLQFRERDKSKIFGIEQQYQRLLLIVGNLVFLMSLF